MYKKTALTLLLLFAISCLKAQQTRPVAISTDSTYTYLPKKVFKELVYKDEFDRKFYYRKTFVKNLKKVYVPYNAVLKRWTKE